MLDNKNTTFNSFDTKHYTQTNKYNIFFNKSIININNQNSSYNLPKIITNISNIKIINTNNIHNITNKFYIKPNIFYINHRKAISELIIFVYKKKNSFGVYALTCLSL